MNACAYVVGPQRGAGAIVFELAGKLGFDTVLPYVGIADAERQADETPLCFFLFSEVPDVRSLGHAAQAIRFSSGRRIRFSPLIYFCKSPSADTIRTLIGMGFDDIITAPFSAPRVAPRLMRQIDTELTYFETSSYFGPDRRRNATPVTDERRGDGQYRQIEIVRHLATGTNVLRDDLQIML